MTDIKHETKQKASHTAGPWVTDGGTHVQALYTPTDGGKGFYHTVARTDQPLVHPTQQEANSRLIAAAPKLLEAARRGREACTILADECREAGDDHHAVIWQRKAAACDAAIAEAEGPAA